MPIENNTANNIAPIDTASIHSHKKNTQEQQNLVISETDIAKLDRYSTAQAANTNRAPLRDAGLIVSVSSAQQAGVVHSQGLALAGIGQSAYHWAQQDPSAPMPKGLQSRWSEFIGQGCSK